MPRPAVQHRAAAASVSSGTLSAKSFSKSGSTPCSSCMIDTLGPVTSDFKKDTVRFAGKTNLDSLTKVFSWQEHDTRPGVLSRFRSGHSSRQVDSVVRGSQVAHQLNSCSHSVSSHNLTWSGIFLRVIAHLFRSLLLSLHLFLLVVVVVRVVGLHCVVHVVVWVLWEGIAALVESVCYWHMEMIHGIRVWDTVRGKMQSMCMKWLGEQSRSVQVLGLGFGNHSKVRYQLGTN